ncbi:MAG TPA: TldD/PmbA family protein [Thermoprotei archaeon]|nr:TldD/PmbA family protein [Thermoprotei archaeon]
MKEILDFCEKTIREWLDRGASYVECRAELRKSFSTKIVDGTVKSLSSGILRGVGVRVLYRGSMYFMSYSSEGVLRGESVVFKPVEKPWMQKVELAEIKPVEDEVIVEQRRKFDEMSPEEKVSVLLEENKKILEDPVKTAETFYEELTVDKWIITSEGTRIHMVMPYIYLSHRATAREAGKINESRARLGGIGGLEVVFGEKLSKIGKLAKKRAVEGLRAKPVKPGVYRVLLDGEMNHLFAHEAVGHASEADSAQTGSLLAGKLGKRVASPIVDLIDDGKFELNGVKGFGWIPYDDEGVPAEKTYIIKGGVLVSYMTDRATAKYFKLKPTGNARAQDFTYPPIVRMRNTFISASSEKEALSNEELLEALGTGLLLKGRRGGQVEPLRGTFTFGVQEVYRVEKGEVKERLASTSISGNFLQVLTKIEAVGKEFDEPESSVGFCGKSGQGMPVGVSGVWLLVSKLHVGG